MSTRNRVEVLITALDQATPVIQNMAKGVAGGALAFGFDLASKAVGGFMSAVNKASDATTDNIMAVGSLASVMGQSYEIADKLNNKITKGLAEQAAALPGSTDDYVTVYRTVSDDVAGMSKELNGGKFSAQKFEQQVVRLTSKFTALKGSASIGEVTQGLQALLGGRKISQLNKLKFFRERNPVLKKNLEKLTELAGQDLNEMNGGKRLEVILKALDMTLTDDTIKRMSATFDAIKQTFLTKMFDPNIGMFGLLRDVDGNLENGMQTAFGAITEALDSVIGEKGILMAIGNLMTAMGIDLGDPMVHLRNAMQGFAGMMNGAAGILRGMAKTGNPQAVIGQVIKIPGMLLNQLGGFINGISASLRSTNFAGMANGAMGAISGILANIDFASLGGVIGAFLASALIAVQNFLINFNWGQLLVVIGQLAIGIIGAIGGAMGAIAGYMWQQYPMMLGQAWVKIQEFFSNLGYGLSGMWSSIIEYLAVKVPEAWMSITAAIGGWFANTTQSIGSLFNQIVGFLREKIAGAISWAAETVGKMVEGIKSAITNLFSTIQNAVTNALSNIQLPSLGDMGGAAMGAASGAASAVGGMVSGMIPGAASGFLPGSGLGGLIGAAIAESRKMPSGANLMMANTSEAVLNRGQQGALAGALGGGGSFAPQISIQAAPGMDVAALADEVMRRIEGAYRQYEQGFLV